MKKIAMIPRADWQTSLSAYAYGVEAAKAAGRWEESVCYEFSVNQIDMIESVANDVHGLIQDATRHAIDGHLLALIGFSSDVAHMIEESWKAFYNNGPSRRNRADLFGRLDFAYDGRDNLKLLGACYDGPSGLFTASIVQWNWLEAYFPDANQFNGLHEGLVERWQELAVGTRDHDMVHLTTAMPDALREGELAYLAATAEEAGVQTTILAVQDIGWDGTHFVDLDNRRIRWLLKLYPWEAMLAEKFGDYLFQQQFSVLDPLWRMPSSNHGLLALLWDMYPEHPNLCRVSLSDLNGETEIIRRSLFGTERPAEQVASRGCVLGDTGPTDNPGGYVFIARPPTFRQESTEMILNTWMIGDKCLGMAVRESRALVGWADAATVPHLFR